MYKKIRNAIISWFADIRIYPGGIILFGDSHYKVKGPDMREILDILQPGDVLLRLYNHYIGSLLIPGYWSHAALYVGNNDVVHMLGEGITKEDILTFMRCDNICVLRTKYKAAIPSALNKAYDYYHLHIPYDYDFDNKNDKELYCTEFVNACYDYPIKSKGKYTLADEFLESDFFDLIWEK